MIPPLLPPTYYLIPTRTNPKKISYLCTMLPEKTKQLVSTLKSKEQLRILFVCLGNICRSPAAEGVMQAIVDAEGAQHRFTIDSAGTGNYHIGDLPDRRMRIHARHRGYDLTHRCRQVCEADFTDFDIIVGMDAQNLRNLRLMAPSVVAAEKVVPMADFFSLATRYDYVPDPYYEGSEGFELVLDLLEDACRNLYDALK